MTPTGFRVTRTRWFARGGVLRTALVADLVAWFADREAAEAHREELERRAWLDPAFNPFDYLGPLGYLTGLPDWALRDWVQDRGLVPPQKGRTWRRWYESKRPDPLMLREALGKLVLYGVEPTYPAAWAAGAVQYTPTYPADDGDVREAISEGHIFHHFHRTEAAGVHWAGLRGEWERRWHGPADRFGTRYRNGSPDVLTAADAAFYEAVPVDCPAGVPDPGPAFLVLRRAYSWAGVEDTNVSQWDSDAGVALSLHPDRAAADDHCADLMRAARGRVNPFEFLRVDWFTGDVLDRVRVHWPGAPDQSGGDPSDRAADYDAAFPGLTDEARAAVWAAVEGRTLFEVQEVVVHPD